MEEWERHPHLLPITKGVTTQGLIRETVNLAERALIRGSRVGAKIKTLTSINPVWRSALLICLWVAEEGLSLLLAVKTARTGPAKIKTQDRLQVEPDSRILQQLRTIPTTTSWEQRWREIMGKGTAVPTCFQKQEAGTGMMKLSVTTARVNMEGLQTLEYRNPPTSLSSPNQQAPVGNKC